MLNYEVRKEVEIVILSSKIKVKRANSENSDEELMVTAAQNSDGSIAVVVFNPTEKAKSFHLTLGEQMNTVSISAQAIQTIMIAPNS